MSLRGRRRGRVIAAIGNGVDDLSTGAGLGGGPRVRVLQADGLAVVEDIFALFPDFSGGVSVG